MRLRTLLGTTFLLVSLAAEIPAAPPIKALILDGQNNHDWKEVTPALKKILEDTGLFAVEVSTTPPEGQSMEGWNPRFADYDVLVDNYNGDLWSEKTRAAFVEYMKNGGGLVVIHAANNAFPEWPEFDEIIGLAGWGGRNEKSGPYVRWREGKVAFDTTPGPGGSHGPQHEIQVVIRDSKHPITAGLPEVWMHAEDEIYNRLRGPAKNLTVLATALTPLDKRGTGEHEPMLFTVEYGKGRVFHTVFGHGAENMRCVGFMVTLQRGAEWAATGKVTQTTVPADFPTPGEARIRELPVPEKMQKGG